MKSIINIEFHGSKVTDKALLDKVKEIWKEKGEKVKELKSIELYYKPEENMCYYIINETNNGSFSVL